jgi:hypothetical protein
MDLLAYALGGLLICALVRRWRPAVTRRAAAGYLVAAAAFFLIPLATPSLQVASDIPYLWRPWSETIPATVKHQPRNSLLGDIPLQLLPYRALVRERLLRLEAPLWVHEVGTGAPLLGNAYAAPFSPLHLLALPLPAARSMTVVVAWQTLMCLLFMHALLLALGARPAGAALAAVSYAFSAFLIAWAYHPQAMSAAWLPGVLLGLVLLRRGERGAFGGLVACGLGLALSGHPETLAHGAVACVAVFLALLARRDEQVSQVSRQAFVGRLAAAAVLTGCLAAPVLLPVLEVLPESERWVMVARVPKAVDPPPFESRFLLLPLQPLLFGSPRDQNWDGPANFNELCSGYGGVLALVLAVAGAALPGDRRRLLLLAAGLAAFLASLGLPPFFHLVDSLPGMSHGAHARLRLLWVLAVAVAAGLGLDDVIRQRRGAWIAGAALAAAGLLLAFHPPADLPWQRAWWIATLAGAALVGALLLHPRLRRAAPLVAVAALGLDLGLLLARYHPAVPASFDLAAPPALARLADEARKAPEPFRVMAEGNDLEPDLGALYGLWDPRGYDPMRPADATLVAGRGFLPRFKVGRELRIESRRFPVHTQRMFDYLGVRYLLTRHQRGVPPPWEPAWNDAGGKVWRNPRALPLFFLPAAAQRVPDGAKAQEQALATPDFAAFGVAEGGPPAGPRPQNGTARIEKLLPNGFDLEVGTVTGGLVVSSVAYADGWRLELLDGPGPATLRKVNGGFVGFEIGPGRHRVRLDYQPAGWRWGLVVAGLAVLVAAGVAVRRRALTPGPSPTPSRPPGEGGREI